MKGIEYRAFRRFGRATLPGSVGAAVQTPVRPQAVVLVGGEETRLRQRRDYFIKRHRA